MKNIRLSQIIQIASVSALVLLIIVIIFLQIKTEDHPNSVVFDNNTPTAPASEKGVNLLADLAYNPNRKTTNETAAEEAVSSLLMIEHIKSKSAVVKNSNPFTLQNSSSILDIFGLFSKTSYAAANDNIAVESLPANGDISTKLNRVIDGQTTSSNYLQMSLILPENTIINSYYNGDYILYETDLSFAVMYQLGDKKYKETIIISDKNTNPSFSFDLEYPSNFSLEQLPDQTILISRPVENDRQAVWQILPAYVVDRKGEIGEVSYKLSDDNRRITYQLDPAFIENATFPVVFDPTVEIPNPTFQHQLVWDNAHNQAILFGGAQVMPTYPYSTYGINETWTYRIGDVPEYRSDHTYDFTICLSSAQTLTFGVNDDITNDNSGFYTISTCTNSSCGTPENFTVNFTAGKNAVTSVNSYNGCFNIGVSGFGEAAGTQYTDAFYRFTDLNHNEIATPVHYTMGDGDNNFALIINNSSPTYLIPGHQGRWQKKYPATSPTARSLFGMVWDDQNDQAIMYGGASYTDFTFLNDTWVYMPPASENEQGEWIRKNPAGAPGKLARVQMAWDSQNNQVIMHSGLLWNYGLYGTITGLTWTYDPDANSGQGIWTNVNSTGPDVFVHAVDWDSQNNQLILFGGDECPM